MQSTGHVKRSIKEYLNGEPQDEQKEIKAILLERKDEVAHAQQLSLASAFSQQVNRNLHHLSFSTVSLNQAKPELCFRCRGSFGSYDKYIIRSIWI